MLRRDWHDAVEHWAGVPCLVCTRWPRELAHTIGREYDERRGPKRNLAYVHPLSVVPLCVFHHRLYDTHRFDLLPHLEGSHDDVIEWAVNRIGHGQAMRRLRTRAEFHQ
jgi:hypothetical protein